MANQNVEPDISPERFQAQANCVNNVILELSSPNIFARHSALRALNTMRSISALAADVTLKIKGRRYRERLIFSLLRELDTFDPELRDFEEYRMILELTTRVLNLRSFQSRAAGRIVARLSGWKDFATARLATAHHLAMFEQRKQRWDSMLTSPDALIDELLTTVANGNEQSESRSQAIVYLTSQADLLLSCEGPTTRCLDAVDSLPPETRTPKEISDCLILFLWCLSKEATEAKETIRKRVLTYSHVLIAAQPDPRYQQLYPDLLHRLKTI